ncbi:M16 family metallopeptidase [Myxococcota bacterium]
MLPTRSDLGTAPFQVLRDTHGSGLRVIAVRMPHAHQAVVEVVVRVGSRFETEQQIGISHFLEHMLFRGTERHPSAHELALAFEQRGACLGAATAVDHSALTLSAPPENLEQVLPWLGEIVRAPLLSGLEVERGIVREEILEMLDERGKWIDASTLVRRECFREHPLGWPITGGLEQIERFGRMELVTHHRAHYTNVGTVIAVAGPVDPDRILPAVAAAFAGLPSGALPASTPPGPLRSPGFTYVHHTASQTALALAFRAAGDLHPDEPSTELLMRLLDDGMSTRLYHRICDERGLCYGVSASYEAYHDSGLVELGAETAHENAVELVREFIAVLRSVRDEGPLPGELEKAQARHRWQLQEMLDDPASVAEFHALGELLGVARDPEERLRQLDQVTPQELRRAAESTLQGQQLAAVAVGSLPRRDQEALAAMVREF